MCSPLTPGHGRPTAPQSRPLTLSYMWKTEARRLALDHRAGKWQNWDQSAGPGGLQVQCPGPLRALMVLFLPLPKAQLWLLGPSLFLQACSQPCCLPQDYWLSFQCGQSSGSEEAAGRGSQGSVEGALLHGPPPPGQGFDGHTVHTAYLGDPERVPQPQLEECGSGSSSC